MIGLLGVLVIVSLTIYIIKSAEPIYLFIKRKLSLYREKKKIRKQTYLYEIRGAELLAAGYEYKYNSAFGNHFIKPGCEVVSENKIKGWSDKKFKEKING